MTISELIAKLEAMRDRMGNVDVTCVDGYLSREPEPRTSVEEDHVFL